MTQYRHKKSICISLFACLTLTACASHGPVTPLPAVHPVPYDEYILDDRYKDAAANVRKQIEAARIEYGLPSLSAAVSINGELVWAGVTGWSNIESQTAANITTRYRIGSTSKAVTSTILARLVDAKKIDLDKPISTWMKKLPQERWAPLTPRQLSSHTAGIVDYEQNRDISGLIKTLRETKQYDNVYESLEIFDGNRLKYAPGSNFHYSSFDVILLSAAIAAAANDSFLNILNEWAVKLAGNLTISADYQNRQVSSRALFYHRKNGRLRRWRNVNHSYKWAAGGLIASSSDLVRLGGAWFDDSFISTKTRNIFWQPQRLSNGKINEQNYAIGWRSNEQTILLGKEKPVHNVHHGGISKGSYSWLNLYPKYKIAVALNSNARLDEFSDFANIEYPITREFLKLSEDILVQK